MKKYKIIWLCALAVVAVSFTGGNYFLGELLNVTDAGAVNDDVLTYDATTKSWYPSAVSGGGGADLSGTSDNQVLFNDGGDFGGENTFTWDGANLVVSGALNPRIKSSRSSPGAAYFELENTSNNWWWYSNGDNSGFEPATVNGRFYFRNLANAEIFSLNFGAAAANSRIELKNGTPLDLEPTATVPVGWTAGLLYVDDGTNTTVNNSLRFYNGTAWEVVSGNILTNDGDGTASSISSIFRFDFLDTIAVQRDAGFQIGATGDTPTGVMKYELASNYLKGYGTADWNIGSETNGIAFHVDNNNRNIGIRTAIPSEALEVNGNAKADSVFIDEVNVQRLGTDANGKIVAKEFWSNQIVQNSNSPYTGTESITDYQINGASGAVTLELPQGTNMRGRVIYLFRTDDNPLETITINTASGAIRGSADVGAEIANRYSSVTLRSNGTDWWVTAINNN